MSKHGGDAPTDAGDESAREELTAHEASDESREQASFTERHPEHFRNPPGHVRELREEDSDPEKE
jgi:hypothetical protein